MMNSRVIAENLFLQGQRINNFNKKANLRCCTATLLGCLSGVLFFSSSPLLGTITAISGLYNSIKAIDFVKGSFGIKGYYHTNKFREQEMLLWDQEEKYEFIEYSQHSEKNLLQGEMFVHNSPIFMGDELIRAFIVGRYTPRLQIGPLKNSFDYAAISKDTFESKYDAWSGLESILARKSINDIASSASNKKHIYHLNNQDDDFYIGKIV